MAHVYCAGPLFNEAERREMSDIARVLEAAGHATFLPHRDGLELAQVLPELRQIAPTPADADAMLGKAIFSLDVFQLLTRADAVVANLNGRVPDEGTVIEAALAWLAGKAVVLYKTDARTVLHGADHPMLLALGDFRVVGDAAELPRVVAQELGAERKGRVPSVLEAGQRLAEACQPSRRGLAATLLKLATG
jgi:nucleoside 2-deoxyribosyltransferase